MAIQSQRIIWLMAAVAVLLGGLIWGLSTMTEQSEGRGAARALDMAYNDPAELEEALVEVERSLAELNAAWREAGQARPMWATRLGEFASRVRGDIVGMARSGVPELKGSLQDFTDERTRQLWHRGELPEKHMECIAFGDRLLYDLKNTCGVYVNDPETIRRLLLVAEQALPLALREPGARFINAQALRKLFVEIRDNAPRLAAFGFEKRRPQLDDLFLPGLRQHIDERYDSLTALKRPETRCKLATQELVEYIAEQCGLHLNSPEHLEALLSTAESALRGDASAPPQGPLADLYRRIRANLESIAANGMSEALPGLRALDGLGEEIENSAFDLFTYIKRCRPFPASR